MEDGPWREPKRHVGEASLSVFRPGAGKQRAAMLTGRSGREAKGLLVTRILVTRCGGREMGGGNIVRRETGRAALVTRQVSRTAGWPRGGCVCARRGGDGFARARTLLSGTGKTRLGGGMAGSAEGRMRRPIFVVDVWSASFGRVCARLTSAIISLASRAERTCHGLR